jgi:hypothetical protein
LQPAGNNKTNEWSPEACITVAKRPTVHFIGGDVAAGRRFCGANNSSTGGGIRTITNSSDNGSVVEYAAFVEGIIQFNRAMGFGFGTASNPAMSRIQSARLAFANTAANGNYGGLGSGECMPDYYGKYRNENLTPRSGNNIPDRGNVRLRYTGDLVVNRNTNIVDGSNILIVVDGDVNIRNNITYNPPYASADRIPSLAIVARGDINVADRVTRLDGVYSTRGTFNTCYNAPPRLNDNDCNQRLRLDGAVVAGRLELRRTFGADGPPNRRAQPGELFNYTTELFFNNVLNDNNNTIETMSQRDLPPRY